LARYAAEHGFNYSFMAADASVAPVPSVLAVKRLAGTSESEPPGAAQVHLCYVALLGNEDGMLTIGDPSYGERAMSASEFAADYGYIGLALAIEPHRNVK
jgi:hypothetical protein